MPSILNRNHLFASLDPQALPKILLITAPSGFGKTVLAEQLVSWFQGQAVWQRISPWQRDWLSLSEQSLALWADVIAEKAETAQANASPREAAQALATGVAASQSSLYVIDDVHYLVGSSNAELWLQCLIESLPPQIHIILVGQDLPLLPWTQFLARGWIWALRADELRFTGTDIQALSSLSREEAERLARQTEGWIAGIRLALDSLSKNSSTAFQNPSGEALFRELARNFLEQQSPDFQHFLFLSSLPERFDAVLCKEALGLGQIETHVNRLQRQAFFLHTESHGYRYHEMLRRFLLDTFKGSEPSQYQKWHEQLAQWFEAGDENEAAIWHYIEAEQVQAAVNLADRIGKELQTLGRWEAILQILSLLGSDASPVFRLRAAIILTEQNRLDESAILLKEAIKASEEQGDSLNVARCHLHLAFIYQKQGLYELALEEAKKVLETEDEDLKAWAKRRQALVYLELGESQQAIELLRSLLPIYSQNLQARGRSGILQDLNEAYLRSGDLETVGMLLQEILALRREGNNPNDLASALNDLGYYYHCCSQYEDALPAFAEGLTQIERFGGLSQQSLCWSRGDTLRDLGRMEEAEEAYLAAMTNSKEKQNAIYPAILMSLAQLRLWQNRLADTQVLLEEAKRFLPESDYLRRRLLEVMFIISQTEQKPSNHKELFEIFDFLLNAKALIKYAQALALSAYFLLSQPEKKIQKRFIAYLKQLPENLFQPFAAHIRHLPKLRVLVNKAGLLEIAGLLDALETLDKQILNTYPLTYPQFPRPRQVELQTLGKALVCLNGDLLSDSAWTVSSAKELFFYLYFSGPKTKEEIAMIFWADHDSVQIRGLLHDTLKRLRRALPEAIAYDGLYYHLNPDYVIKDDKQQFRDFVHRAKQLAAKDARTEDLFQRAKKLYHGPFLPFIDRAWVEPLRTEVEADYLSALLGLANCALARDRDLEAIPFYQQALEKDPYNEDILRRLLKVLAQTGQQAAVQACFDAFMKRLEMDLDLSPSQLTWETFFKALHAGH